MRSEYSAESESMAIIYSEVFQPMLSERRASLKNLVLYQHGPPGEGGNSVNDGADRAKPGHTAIISAHRGRNS
jgi:hypothetical protein